MPATDIDQGPGAQVGGIQPVFAGGHFHQNNGAGHVQTVKISQFPLAGINQRARGARFRQRAGRDAVGQKREDGQGGGLRAKPQCAVRVFSNRNVQTEATDGFISLLGEGILDIVGGLAGAVAAGAAVSVGGQLLDVVYQGRRRCRIAGTAEQDPAHDQCQQGMGPTALQAPVPLANALIEEPPSGRPAGR